MNFKMPALFHNLPKNFLQVFSGRNLLYHLLAILLTCLIVESGLDWAYYRLTRLEWIAQLALPAVLLGTVIPILATLAILSFGTILKNQRLTELAWAYGASFPLNSTPSVYARSM